MFPGMLAVAAALGSLDRFLGVEVARRAEREVVGVLTTLLADSGEGTVDAVRALFREGDAGVFTIGLVGAVWAASRGMAAVLRALSDIYDTEETRSGLRRRGVAVVLAIGSLLLVALVLVMIVLGPLFGFGRDLARTVGLGDAYGTLWSFVALPVAFLALVGWTTVAFHAVPHTHVGWRHHAAGAALTGVLWLAVSVGLRLYLHFVGGNEVFGVLGGALVVLIWMYLLSLALLIGAELNAVLARTAWVKGADRTSDGSSVEAAASRTGIDPKIRAL